MPFPKVNKMNKEAAVRGENSKGLNILIKIYTFYLHLLYCSPVSKDTDMK